MWPTLFKEDFIKALFAFLWRQWAQLGVAAHLDHADQWIIDPEALLLFTLQAARRDPRLFDEVVDWSAINSRRLAIQRFKNLLVTWEPPALTDTLSGLANVIHRHDKKGRWRSLAFRQRASERPVESLFFDRSGDPMPLTGDPDPAFLSFGLRRSPIQLRGMSQPVPMRRAPNLVFRLRALFGLGPRAETMAYLVSNPGANASTIAREIYYSLPQVNETLADFVASGVATVNDRNERRYSIDDELWGRWLGFDHRPVWIDWWRVFIGLIQLLEFVTDPRLELLSEYMLRSKILSVLETLSRSFAGSALRVHIPRDLTISEAEPQLELATLDVIKALK